VDVDHLLRTGDYAHAAEGAGLGVNEVDTVTIAMYCAHRAHLGADTALGAGPHFVVAWGREMGDDGQGCLLGVIFPEKVQRAGQEASPAT